VNEKNPDNKALHRTAIPLRSIAAGELCRYVYRSGKSEPKLTCGYRRPGVEFTL
jgi:hypothetical protein